EIDVFVFLAVAPHDVARARAVDVHQAHAVGVRWAGRRLVDDVARGPALAVHVEPHVDGVEPYLHQIIQAVAVDVVHAQGRALDVRLIRGGCHGDVALVAKAAGRTIVELPGAPKAVAATRPIAHVAATKPHDVLDPVAVH